MLFIIIIFSYHLRFCSHVCPICVYLPNTCYKASSPTVQRSGNPAPKQPISQDCSVPTSTMSMFTKVVFLAILAISYAALLPAANIKLTKGSRRDIKMPGSDPSSGPTTDGDSSGIVYSIGAVRSDQKPNDTKDIPDLVREFIPDDQSSSANPNDHGEP